MILLTAERSAVPHAVVMMTALLLLSSCSADDSVGNASPLDAPWSKGWRIPAESQAPGDAEQGRHTLLNGSYMSCGVPFRLWNDPTFGPTVRSSFSSADPLPGREGMNADLPYDVTAFAAADGTEVFNYNCLSCHGGRFDGELIIGLGNAAADFTDGLGGGPASQLDAALIELLGLSEPEKAHMNKIVRVAKVIGPETVMRTVGNNPAEALAIILSVHHDRDTLAWSDEPLIPLIVRDENGVRIPDPRLTSDPPPWWRSSKKHALFYNGMARGDHRGTMAYASSVCVDTVPEAQRVDDLFRDIQAYIRSIDAPVYSRSIDAALAARGKKLFQRDCSGCHGQYADDASDDRHDTYPNLLIPLDVVGTDPVVANGGVVHAPELVDWYNGSFYGQITRMEPNNPWPGYVAPPLDGVWATGPFLHNGSVPTIELVLNSKARPKYWKRVDFDTTKLDEEALGWPWVEVPYSQAEAPADEQKLIYDTTHWSQSNAGHTFGDHFDSSERRAVLEYLKTL